MLSDPVKVLRGLGQELGTWRLVEPGGPVLVDFEDGPDGSFPVTGYGRQPGIGPGRAGVEPLFPEGGRDAPHLRDIGGGLAETSELAQDTYAEVEHRGAVRGPSGKQGQRPVDNGQRPVITALREMKPHGQLHQRACGPDGLADPVRQPGGLLQHGFGVLVRAVLAPP